MGEYSPSLVTLIAVYCIKTRLFMYNQGDPTFLSKNTQNEARSTFPHFNTYFLRNKVVIECELM
jgi:hypothetical protein